MNSPALAFWMRAVATVMLQAEQRPSLIAAKARWAPTRCDRASSRFNSASGLRLRAKQSFA